MVESEMAKKLKERKMRAKVKARQERLKKKKEQLAVLKEKQEKKKKEIKKIEKEKVKPKSLIKRKRKLAPELKERGWMMKDGYPTIKVVTRKLEKKGRYGEKIDFEPIKKAYEGNFRGRLPASIVPIKRYVDDSRRKARPAKPGLKGPRKGVINFERYDGAVDVFVKMPDGKLKKWDRLYI